MDKTPEQIAAEAKAAAAPAAPAAPAAKTPEQLKAEADAAVPEKYELKAPDGMKLDDKLVEGFAPIAKDFGLNNAKAQKLADLYATHVQAQITAAQTAESAKIAKWQEDFKAIPGHEKILAGAKRALTIAPKEVQDMFNGSWLGSHPALIQYLNKLGSLLHEDDLAEGANRAAPRAGATAADMYPSMKPAA